MIADFNGLGLSIEPVRGARAWDVTDDGHLEAIYHDYRWTPGENVAKCFGGGFSAFVAQIAALGFSLSPAGYVPGGVAGPSSPRPLRPAAGGPTSPSYSHDMSACGCGFYGYYDGSNDYRSPRRVEGIVEAYGETIVGTRGFRAGKARIVALCLPKAGPTSRRWHRWPLVERLAARRGPWWVTVASGFTFSLSTFLAPANLLAIPCLLVALAAAYVYTANLMALRLWRSRQTERFGPSAEQLAAVRRNYPDVPVFDTFAAMVKAFPPSRGEPVPLTDGPRPTAPAPGATS